MRILHLTASLAGVAGRTVSTLAGRQRRAGHAPVVVAGRFTGRYSDEAQPLRASGIHVRLVDSIAVPDPVARLQFLGELQRDPDLQGIDVIHAHDEAGGLLALALGASEGRPATVRSVYDSGSQVDVAALNRTGRVVASSRGSHDLLAHLGVAPARLRLVPPGVEPVLDPLDGLDSTDVELLGLREAARGRATVCCLDSLCDRRGERLLLDAVSLLPGAERPLCAFVHAGEPNGLLGLSDERGLRPWVRAIGHRPDARPFVRLADWLIVPSLRADALALPVYEAFCDRVPIVAADTPTLGELLGQPENGVVFARGDRSALADALKHALSMPHEHRSALCTQAHTTYRTSYQGSTMTERYLDAYADLLSELDAVGYQRVA